ncbi:MAG: hypothetical protein A2312_04670 [Candidatus Staskawiczbacteria bacterium RIFOXYB2_FULL_32_9]|uniref:Methyltransferase domain-containing protein n=1 Tax=Candidatus Staskawiczbacteria bacterium RIFOXYD1_FULL_32_13 TaxID=1802234 RepID=A0A1G2JQ77_9BACT|nr:MAG: hypothetical protein UR22_C0012G0025 [Parcubacteria group bacterium GW2011_GWC2_32_10]OGZ77304.1 MAG: hypothetical protein A2256_03505 [Candidatus Staskawiczbacteria bacterium RIFOXYA2_FULL_32_7]OGZ79851.1 MAG: hypothetical protein A2360_00395 [Candidatus Staskawiczbacteria bacterium RIFOXYB1_FULL_32_11]OGZ81228.1 MAG: hypothetical protein A2312_04670 [Candidatus Staskawiczbacteria bacterium RIFOXYB2_FULL_32_9]OGZ88390.1 MAG: hypothetical protein A2463_00530 [Candidatus Staskawiczbacter
MKLIVKHYYCFGKKAENVGRNLLISSSWDTIRLDEDESTPFSIPSNRNKWIEKCKNHTIMVERGKAIANFLKIKRKNFKKVISFGFGAGFMEYNLKANYPEIQISCSDFAPKAVERLKNVFTEADNVEVFDMLKDEWINYGVDTLYILHRLDADFNNKQWDKIFCKMNQTGIENILFVPCDISKIGFLLKSKLGYFSQVLQGNKMSFAGYLRNRNQLVALFDNYYKLQEEFPIHDLTGFLLKIK